MVEIRNYRYRLILRQAIWEVDDDVVSGVTLVNHILDDSICVSDVDLGVLGRILQQCIVTGRLPNGVPRVVVDFLRESVSPGLQLALDTQRAHASHRTLVGF